MMYTVNCTFYFLFILGARARFGKIKFDNLLLCGILYLIHYYNRSSMSSSRSGSMQLFYRVRHKNDPLHFVQIFLQNYKC